MTVPGPAGYDAAGKVSSIVAGMVAGADSIDDLDLLREGAIGRVLPGVKAPSTLGTFLRAFTFGHVRQLGAVAAGVLTALARLVPLRSADDSLDIPEPPAPRLTLTVTWRSSTHATLGWTWAYGVRHYPVDSREDLGLVRNPAEEAALRAKVSTELLRKQEVRDGDALALAIHPCAPAPSKRPRAFPRRAGRPQRLRPGPLLPRRSSPSSPTRRSTHAPLRSEPRAPSTAPQRPAQPARQPSAQRPRQHHGRQSVHALQRRGWRAAESHRDDRRWRWWCSRWRQGHDRPRARPQMALPARAQLPCAAAFCRPGKEIQGGEGE